MVFRHPNVYLDISDLDMNLWPDFYLPVINERLADKTFFGSAHPFTPLPEALNMLDGFDLNPEVREKVMYANAKRFLHLD